MKSGCVAGALSIILAAQGAAWAQPSPGPKERPLLHQPAQSVSCAYFGKDSPAVHERRMLRMAPEGAERTSDHVLTVR